MTSDEIKKEIDEILKSHKGIVKYDITVIDTTQLGRRILLTVYIDRNRLVVDVLRNKYYEKDLNSKFRSNELYLTKKFIN